MSLVGRRVAQIDIKCNGDVFLGLFRYRISSLPNIAPNHVHGSELHEGEWGAIGSIFTMTYLIDGKEMSSKQVLEEVDEKNKSLTYKMVEGDMMQMYKSLKGSIKIDKNDDNSLVTWMVEYEKVNEHIPDPDALIDLASKITKSMETHLLK